MGLTHAPQDHLVGLGVAFHVGRSGSSACSRPSAVDSLSSSLREAAATATGSSGSGITHGSTSSGSVGAAQRVAGLGVVEPGDGHDVTGRLRTRSG